MKNKILAILVLISTTCMAQTNVISNKSHSGDLSEIKYEKDNFGIPGPSVDSVIYLSDSCLILVFLEWGGRYTYHDTVCEQYYAEHINNPKELKNMFGNNVKLVGFKKGNKIKNSNQTIQQNGINWFFGALILSFLLYVSFPYLIKRKS